MFAGKTDYVSSQNLCEEEGWLGGNKALGLLLGLLPSEGLHDTGNSLQHLNIGMFLAFPQTSV